MRYFKGKGNYGEPVVLATDKKLESVTEMAIELMGNFSVESKVEEISENEYNRLKPIINITKEQAYNCMKKGYKVSHKLLHAELWLYMENNQMVSNQGPISKEFWDERNSPSWLTDWYVLADMSERFKEIYQEERDKLSVMPNADDDFIALEKAYTRYAEETSKLVGFIGRGV